jgi:hypothetical protein
MIGSAARHISHYSVTNKDFFFAFWEQTGEPIELFLELLIVHVCI